MSDIDQRAAAAIVSFLSDDAQRMTCSEFEAVADFLRANGVPAGTIDVLTDQHRLSDEEGDHHWIPRHLRAVPDEAGSPIIEFGPEYAGLLGLECDRCGEMYFVNGTALVEQKIETPPHVCQGPS